MQATTLPSHAGDGATELVLAIAHQDAIVDRQGVIIDSQGAAADRQGVIAGRQGAAVNHQGVMRSRLDEVVYDNDLE
jgi:hypothetical protein